MRFATDLDRAPVVTRFWWVLGHLTLMPAAYGLFRLSVAGRRNIPDAGPVLIVCNHISQADPVVLGVAATPRKSYYFAKAELFRVPFLRGYINRMGAFPVERGGADRRALRLSREVLARGDMLLMFPEGSRFTDGRLRPGLSGAGSLALIPGVTVIPAAIWGTHRLGHKTRVTFGAPIDMSDIDGGSRAARSRQAVDRMMAAIAGLIPASGGPETEPPGHIDG
ncbi:MAG TPA: lysophospholipid acyltransferase family protein [Miltoncostaeaceae bacterium]|nr:lysophospholipid acyltransferase family protein [Miltoncostaeaceae bacterium]